MRPARAVHRLAALCSTLRLHPVEQPRHAMGTPFYAFEHQPVWSLGECLGRFGTDMNAEYA